MLQKNPELGVQVGRQVFVSAITIMMDGTIYSAASGGITSCSITMETEHLRMLLRKPALLRQRAAGELVAPFLTTTGIATWISSYAISSSWTRTSPLRPKI